MATSGSAEIRAQPAAKSWIGRLGPGLITGASDDDPSGIGTYAQAGAQLGFGISWMMLITFPLMVAIQEISARVGRVTGRGIAGNVCRHYPGWLLQIIVVLLFVANAVNIGADLGAMGDALRLLLPAPASLYVVLFGVACILAQIFLQYALYVRVLKWLCLSLFAYVAALATVHVPRGEALKGLVVPRLTWNTDFLTTMVAIAGTTISPYLFFWQAAEEAEDIRVKPERTPLKRRPPGAGGLRAHPRRYARRYALLERHCHRHYYHDGGDAARARVTDIESSAQAAEALKPVAGEFAY